MITIPRWAWLTLSWSTFFFMFGGLGLAAAGVSFGAAMFVVGYPVLAILVFFFRPRMSNDHTG